MTKWMRDILEYPEVIGCLKKTSNDVRILKNIKRMIWFSGWILGGGYRRQRREYEKRYKDIVKNGMIMNLKGEHSGIKFYLPLLRLERHVVWGEYIQRKIFRTEDYFDTFSLQWLKEKKFIKEGMNVLDIGANIGNHTIYFVKECRVNYVYSFEPISDTYKMLCKNCELNELKNVLLNNFALGRKKASVKIKKFSEENYGGTSLQYGSEKGITCYALDDLYIDKKIDFVKIDVEGFENEVLLGGKNLIRKNKPVIYIEIFKENRNIVEKTLLELGYVMVEKRSEDYLYLPR